MKVALVQPYGDNYTYSLDELEEKLQHFLAKQPTVDLIVFPEAYEYIEHEKLSPWDAVRALGDKFQTAVIVGYSLDIGTEEAYYYNPNADEAQYETNFSFYIKHATAHRVMFEEALSEENIATIYAPVYLKGKHIQFSICHDMYYPLIMERFDQEGMDIYINLTGGNVKMGSDFERSFIGVFRTCFMYDGQSNIDASSVRASHVPRRKTHCSDDK